MIDRSWVCPKCRKVHDRDVNAAKNILNRGLTILKQSSSGTDDYRHGAEIRLDKSNDLKNISYEVFKKKTHSESEAREALASS